MYNKIAPIILNSGKANGLSDVFVAQPDSLKETLAGKVFIIAEIGGKKNDGRKVLNFLISSLDDNYYNDEKISLRDKIEGLKIENIFEAAISKTNKSLSEFLVDEKIKLNTAATNLTIGVIYENKLYFSSFGKNRALLIYRHGEQFELINVEANAADVNLEIESSEKAVFKTPSIFSSVISGEIPTGSYFVFASEATLEYVSGNDLINIITKLPPIVAAEQIKNILAKMNSFLPFLGVIIKNTVGIDNQEVRDEVEENLTAHSSISSLNYTEQKTERMLAPAGLISFSKIYLNLCEFIKNLKPKPKPVSRKVYRAEEELGPVAAPPDLGQVKSLNSIRSDSFLIKEKIFFKKQPNWFSSRLKKIFSGLPSSINFPFLPGLKARIGQWTKDLNKKNRLLFVVLAAAIIIFLISLGVTNWARKQQAAKNNFNNLVATIQDKQDKIDSNLLYNNEEGAKSLLLEARDLLAYFPQVKQDQIALYKRLEDRLNSQANKIQKVVQLDSLEKVNDLSGLNVSNIVWASGKIYAAGANVIYGLTPQSSSSTKLELAGATSLSNPQFDKKSLVYYWDNNKIAKFDLKTNRASLLNINGEFNAGDATSYKIFNGRLYILAKAKNQIYLYNNDANGYKLKGDWLKNPIDLSQASDLYIDGSVYILKTNGEVLKFYVSKPVDYKAAILSPAMTAASKIIVGTEYVYIFEASAKRLVVLAIKDGHLMNQYLLNSLAKPQDFTVDEKNKQAYFLDNDKIYRIKLNQ